MGIDAILAIVSLLAPPAIDFIKKKFLTPESDTPEATMSALATTKPEVMPEYLKGIAGLLEAKTKYFNRDVCGTPGQWVVNLRAAIRPVGVVLSFLILVGISYASFKGLKMAEPNVVDGVRYACITVISSWFGDRLSDDVT